MSGVFWSEFWGVAWAVVFGVWSLAMFGAGYLVRSRTRRRRWADLRVVKRSGDPLGAFVETRDWGRRNDYGTPYRYEVRRLEEGELVESRRYLDPEKAVAFHEEAAAR